MARAVAFDDGVGGERRRERDEPDFGSVDERCVHAGAAFAVEDAFKGLRDADREVALGRQGFRGRHDGPGRGVDDGRVRIRAARIDADGETVGSG